MKKRILPPDPSKKLKICHCSDTHGLLPKLKNTFNLVVHSGDFFPDFQVSQWNHAGSNSVQYMNLQEDWLKSNIDNVKTWLSGSPLFFIQGNHDWARTSAMEKLFQDNGINAICIHNKITSFNGINFYGFPYVPAINGSFNYERDIPEMTLEVDKLIEDLSQSKIDVLVLHAPLYGVLDWTWGGYHIGNSVLSNMLDYKLDKNMMPNYILCGHCHENSGITSHNNILSINSACTQHIVEI